MKHKFLTLIIAFVAGITFTKAEILTHVQIDNLYYSLNISTKEASVVYKSFAAFGYNIGWDITTANIPEKVVYDEMSFTVVRISERAFCDCLSLENVTIPSTVTSIGDGAFCRCPLSSIEIPNSVTSIEDYAFSGCTGLTSPVYNTHVFAYMPCTYLGTYSIPEGIESIAGYAFEDCTGLISIEIPSSIKSLSESAFSGCKGLTSVTIPNSVTSIGRNTFGYCIGLTSVEIPNSVTSIGDYAFDRCVGLTSVTIGNSVTSIGERAFYNCSSLTSVTIPNSVANIGIEAFDACSNITSVVWNAKNCKCWNFGNQVTSFTFGEKVEIIPASLCSNMKELTGIIIPNSVTSIGDRAFEHCTGLTSITCDAVTPPTLGDEVFFYVHKNIPVYVPEESIDIYKSADQWQDFTNIQTINKSPTSIDNTVSSSSNPLPITMKVIKDNRILILTDDTRTYTLTGQRVK